MLKVSRISFLFFICLFFVDLALINIPLSSNFFIDELNLMYVLAPIFCCLMLAMSVASGAIYIERTVFFISFLALAVWAMLNSFVISLDRSISIQYSLIFFLWLIIYLSFAQARKVNSQDIIVILSAILTIYISGSIIFSMISGNLRLSGIELHGDANRMGAYSIMLAIFSLFLRKKKICNSWLAETMFVISAIGIMYSGSRTVIAITLVLSLFGLFGFTRLFDAKRSLAIMCIVFIGLIVLLVIARTTNDVSMINLANKFLGFIFEFPGATNTQIAFDRHYHYYFAWEILMSNWRSFLFGIGLESYRVESINQISSIGDFTIHGFYLQIFVGLGVIGIILILLMMISLFHRIRCVSDLFLRESLMLLFVFFSFFALTAPIIFSRELLFLLPLLAVFSIRYQRSGISSDNEPLERNDA